MAWHVLHTVLEQVRIHATFPGKFWIMLTFIFRIIIVARIGDNVYNDEQALFYCNTLTPGCQNVCFNRFSPISQLRYWSLMVLTVSFPTILFFLYSTHKIYHAQVKFPTNEEESSQTSNPPFVSGRKSNTSDDTSSFRTKSKHKRGCRPFISTSSLHRLYSVKQIRYNKNERKMFDHNFFHDREKMNYPRANHVSNIESFEKPLYTTGWNEKEDENCLLRSRSKIFRPIPEKNKPNYFHQKSEEETTETKEKKPEMLKNPQIYRAYWWHVIIRLVFEAGFLVGQYFLYGFTVPELYECRSWPCPTTTHCFVSRPTEKTCLNWLMYGLGGTSCLLSILEILVLGWKRLKYAFCFHGSSLTYEEKRRDLAALAHQPHQTEMSNKPMKFYSSNLSLDSMSSATTINSI